MRFIALLAAGIALSLPALADSPTLSGAPAPAEVTVLPGHEAGIYRFGATYSSTASHSALACQSQCRADDACFAWSYLVGMGTAGPRCELKRSGGRVSHNPSATSGLSPRKERQKSPVRIVTHTPTELAGGTVNRTAGTVVTSQPVPLGASPSVTYSSTGKAKRIVRYPATATPTPPSQKAGPKAE